mmetsp:Transcript_55079/g.167374  ORF Transcript_55079/g.167374 Transcript_55079/m.167374 type:complete len:310 (-) Transcript_55079:849-1778(-)
MAPPGGSPGAGGALRAIGDHRGLRDVGRTLLRVVHVHHREACQALLLLDPVVHLGQIGLGLLQDVVQEHLLEGRDPLRDLLLVAADPLYLRVLDSEPPARDSQRLEKLVEATQHRVPRLPPALLLELDAADARLGFLILLAHVGEQHLELVVVDLLVRVLVHVGHEIRHVIRLQAARILAQDSEDLALRDTRVPVHVHLLEGLCDEPLVLALQLQHDGRDELGDVDSAVVVSVARRDDGRNVGALQPRDVQVARDLLELGDLDDAVAVQIELLELLLEVCVCRLLQPQVRQHARQGLLAMSLTRELVQL